MLVIAMGYGRDADLEGGCCCDTSGLRLAPVGLVGQSGFLGWCAVELRGTRLAGHFSN